MLLKHRLNNYNTRTQPLKAQDDNIGVSIEIFLLISDTIYILVDLNRSELRENMVIQYKVTRFPTHRIKILYHQSIHASSDTWLHLNNSQICINKASQYS